MKGIRQLLLLCALCAQLTGAARAADYKLAIRGRHICYQEAHTGAWVDTGVCADQTLGAQDRLLLQAGLHLHGRAALSRALEDFCS